jgi:hypothetical protein
MKNSKKNDLGIVLLELNNSKKTSNILNTIKQIWDDLPFNQMCIFNSYSEIINHYQIPILHINQLKFFDGQVIVFDTAALRIARSCYKLNKIFLYAENLAWQQAGVDYMEWCSICSDSNIDIIAKNQQIYDLYEIMWKKPLGISEDFDYETIKQFIQ